jgi:hypothetical protein
MLIVFIYIQNLSLLPKPRLHELYLICRAFHEIKNENREQETKPLILLQHRTAPLQNSETLPSALARGNLFRYLERLKQP